LQACGLARGHRQRGWGREARNIDIAATIDPMRSLGIIDDEAIKHIWLVASSTNFAATARCTRSIKTIVNT
jgi:hypothetical protein